MNIFKFNQFGQNLGTRLLGVEAREKLMPFLQEEEKVVLDFEGVDVVSNSFADECLAKLLLNMPPRCSPFCDTRMFPIYDSVL